MRENEQKKEKFYCIGKFINSTSSVSDIEKPHRRIMRRKGISRCRHIELCCRDEEEESFSFHCSNVYWTHSYVMVKKNQSLFIHQRTILEVDMRNEKNERNFRNFLFSHHRRRLFDISYTHLSSPKNEP